MDSDKVSSNVKLYSYTLWLHRVVHNILSIRLYQCNVYLNVIRHLEVQITYSVNIAILLPY